jgi:[acyl-carrier-protein] S-malonyltransferase
MGKTAFVFPGQGSQYAGMGKEPHDAFACARGAFHEADEAIGFPLAELCFRGPEESLKLTENTQPAVLAVSIAILRVLEERGMRPDYVAGHSLGEYSALVCAGALTLRDAVQVVRKRGRYMQEAVPAGKGAMAAIIGLEARLVEEACRESSQQGIVSPANFNSPDQTVIAGEVGAVANASERAKQKGAKRVVPLPVSAPFHCELMAPARDRLKVDLDSIRFEDLRIPLISNVDAAEVVAGEQARDSLVRQVCAPVRWVDIVQLLAARGVDKFVEVGPGRVLVGLVRKIAPQAQALNVEGIRGIEALASLLTSAKM